MAATGINSEDRLVQATFAAHLKDKLGWDTVYAFNAETFGADGTLGRNDTTEAVLTHDDLDLRHGRPAEGDRLQPFRNEGRHLRRCPAVQAQGRLVAVVFS